MSKTVSHEIVEVAKRLAVDRNWFEEKPESSLRTEVTEFTPDSVEHELSEPADVSACVGQRGGVSMRGTNKTIVGEIRTLNECQNTDTVAGARVDNR